jgi:hypothetical protein
MVILAKTISMHIEAVEEPLAEQNLVSAAKYDPPESPTIDYRCLRRGKMTPKSVLKSASRFLWRFFHTLVRDEGMSMLDSSLGTAPLHRGGQWKT